MTADVTKEIEQYDAYFMSLYPGLMQSQTRECRLAYIIGFNAWLESARRFDVIARDRGIFLDALNAIRKRNADEIIGSVVCNEIDKWNAL